MIQNIQYYSLGLSIFLLIFTLIITILLIWIDIFTNFKYEIINKTSLIIMYSVISLSILLMFLSLTSIILKL